MTTIAYDGITLATDSLVSSGSVAFGTGKKLFKLKEGCYAALAGNLALMPEILSWLQGGPKPELQEDEEIGGLYIDKKGVPWEFDNSLRLFPACIPWGGGSGGHIALTAMKCGKSAAEAVEVACELDLRSRGPVVSVEVKRGG